MMQINEGRIRETKKIPAKVKEVAAAVLLLCAGGTALAWGLGQMYRPAAAPVNPDDQCRMLANALLAGDSEMVFRHLNPADAKHLKMDFLKLKAFQEEMLAPRLSVPLAWRPRQNRAYSCQGNDGIVFVHMDEPTGGARTAISLIIKNQDGAVTFRYDDLIKILSNLDKATNLTEEQREERMRQDARAMLNARLDGFSLLHPGGLADDIYSQEALRLEQQKQAALATLPEPKPDKAKVRAQISALSATKTLELPVTH